MGKLKLLLAVAAFHIAFISFGKKIEIAMLNGRFSFIFPAGTRLSRWERSYETNDNFTSAIYKNGDEEIVCSARDLFSIYTSDLLERLKTNHAEETLLSVNEIFNKDSVIVYRLSYPLSQPLYTKDILIIKNPDNILSRVQINSHSKSSEAKKHSEKLINEILLSFKKGTARSNLDERIEKNFILDTTNLVSIKLPKNYVLQWGRYINKISEHFLIVKPLAYGISPTPSVTMLFREQLAINNLSGDSIVRLADTEGEFMSAKGKWLNYFDKENRTFTRKQVFASDEIKAGVKISIEITAGAQQDIEDLAAIVKNIVLKPGY